MKTLAIMQNRWFPDAERFEKSIKRWRETRGEKQAMRYRSSIIRYSLFAGCKSGRVLKSLLTQEEINEILWDEASPKIGNHSSSVFPPDIEHLQRLYDQHNPDFILAFGRVAQSGVLQIEKSSTTVVVELPHPASRQKNLNNLLNVKIKQWRESW